MKILMMTNTYTPVVGGVEASIRGFADRFRQGGHKVLIVAPAFKEMPAREFGVVRIPAIQEFNHSDFSVNLPIPGLLSKLMNDFRPDIVHSHHPFLVGDMAMRLCGQYGVPLIFTYHTMFEDYLHYLPFQNDLIKRFVVELAVGYANLTDHVVVPSQSVYDILRDRGVEVPVDVVPTGVNLKRFSQGNGALFRKRMGIPQDARVVGHVGRLTAEKNLEFLTGAVAAVMKQRKDVHFLVIGRGPDEAEMERLLAQEGVLDRFHWSGVLQGQDVIDGYHAMDVFAFASYTETQGLVLAEALAAGVPVVAVNAPGVREAVRDGQNGRLLARQDHLGFVEALIGCLSLHPEQFQDLRVEARRSSEIFSIESCARKMLDVYHSARVFKREGHQEKRGIWINGMNRVRTEWEMAKNIFEASEAALRSVRPEGDAGAHLLAGRHRRSWVLRWKRRLSRKEWSARLLNLKRSHATEIHRGLIMIQIDGLSRTQLIRAMENGAMPFLRRLIKTQGYKLYPFYTGLPSSTPSVQGELFYGVRQIVPAFAFFNPATKKNCRMYVRENALEIEQQLKANSPSRGLLAEGGSYSNVYAGGAGEIHFCAVKIGWDMLWRGVNPFKMFLLALTHVYDFLRMGVLVIVETVVAVMDFLIGISSGENFRKELKFIPTRSFICILLRELVTLGGRLDIARGLPVVHINFLGYDEQAHRRGPSSRFAHRALPGIDRAIAQIYWQAVEATRRDYEVWIYSDHGQEDCQSYAMKYGKTVGQAVTEIYEQGKGSSSSFVGSAALQQGADREGVESQRARYLGGWLGRALFSFIGLSGANEASRSVEQGSVVVTAIGPTGNIYLPQEFSPEERDAFARRLVDEAKIPVVLAPDGIGRARVWNEEGVFTLPEDAPRIIGEGHPYLTQVTEDLIHMCHHPYGGAFTFMGWRPGDKPMTFPVENGAHAGPGLEETNAFALLPSDVATLYGGRKDMVPPDAPGLEHPFCALRPFNGVFLRTFDLRECALNFLRQARKLDPILATRPAASLARDPRVDKRMLRVMTYNVHSCIGMDGKISAERIARVIGRHDPDIVALQELDLRKARTGGLDQPHIIAKALEMMYHFHPNIQIAEEHYGSAVLSRYPMKLVQAGKLPAPAGNSRIEPRGAIWCVIDLGWTRLQFMNTHLGLRPDERLLQARAMCGPQWLGHPDCRHPVILCGDFNSLPDGPACRLIRETLRDAQMSMEGHSPSPTWFSHFPMGRIDHVFVSPDIEVCRVNVSRTDLEKRSSDHLPLIVDVRFLDQASKG